MPQPPQKPTVTIPVDVTKKAIGYVVNASLSPASQRSIAQLQQRLTNQFPGVFWAAPVESLHITLLDLITPLTDYADNPDVLYEKVRDGYVRALERVLRDQPPISVKFDTIQLFPAALIVKGQDDGSFKRIRATFMQEVTLLPDTKLPPTIIHSTIGKFLQPIPLDAVSAVLHNQQLTFEEAVQNFRLVRETQVYMLDYRILNEFQLKPRSA